MAGKKKSRQWLSGHDDTIAKGSLGSVYWAGVTDLGVLDTLSVCRGTPTSPRLTETNQVWSARHSHQTGRGQSRQAQDEDV